MQIRFQPDAEAELPKPVCGIHFNAKAVIWL